MHVKSHLLDSSIHHPFVYTHTNKLKQSGRIDQDDFAQFLCGVVSINWHFGSFGIRFERFANFSLDLFVLSNNLLYPTVHASTMTLMNSCRTCTYTEPARNVMVYRNDLMSVSKEQAGVIDQLMKDPTLPRSREHSCPKCGNNESVFFQDQSKRTFNRMIYFFVCTQCNHVFKDNGIKIWRRIRLPVSDRFIL